MLCYPAAGAALMWLRAKQLPTAVPQEQVWGWLHGTAPVGALKNKHQPVSGMNFGSMSRPRTVWAHFTQKVRVNYM